MTIQDLIINGYTISKNDTEITNLAPYRRYNQSLQIQVYKKNFKGGQYCELFYNIRDALKKFEELVKL